MIDYTTKFIIYGGFYNKDVNFKISKMFQTLLLTILIIIGVSTSTPSSVLD